MITDDLHDAPGFAIPKLKAWAAKVIRDQVHQADPNLVDLIDEISVIHKEVGPDRNFAMYEIIVKLDKSDDGIPTCDLLALTRVLDRWCDNEESDANREVDGNLFVIGDGDDSLAVTFKDHEFHIWLRTWGPKESKGPN